MDEDFRTNLACCTDTIIDEIAAGLPQAQIAITYAMAMKSATQKVDAPDWAKINAAILAKWKMSGLDRIKRLALGILMGKVGP